MIVSYSYRGVKTVLNDNFNRPKISLKGNVTFETPHWTDGNKKVYKVTLEPYELLLTAQRCLEQLNLIAGTHYEICKG